MIESQIVIINRLGIHARAAAKLVTVTNHFSCSIWLGKQQDFIDAKSIMNVMMLAASKGTVLTLRTEGTDEEQAHKAVTEIINNRFDEDE